MKLPVFVACREVEECLKYFGTLASRVRTVFVDFHTEMWRFGGMSNAVMHNEVAPGQHEILPIFALMACLGKARKARRPSPRVSFWKHFLQSVLPCDWFV